MKPLKLLLTGAAISCLAPSPPTFAQGIPVYDNASVVQTILQLEEMAKDAQKQLQQIEAITGARNTGSISNGLYEQKLKQYLPNTWEDTMDMMNAGSLPSGALETKNIYSNIYNQYIPITGAQAFTNDPNGFGSKALDRKTRTTIAAMAASEQVFNQILQRNQVYQNLLDELNKSPDMKNSIDLNARIQAENGMALNELMRQNAILIQQNSSLDNESLVDTKRATKANKYNPEKAKQAMEITP